MEGGAVRVTIDNAGEGPAVDAGADRGLTVQAMVHAVGAEERVPQAAVAFLETNHRLDGLRRHCCPGAVKASIA